MLIVSIYLIAFGNITLAVVIEFSKISGIEGAITGFIWSIIMVSPLIIMHRDHRLGISTLVILCIGSIILTFALLMHIIYRDSASSKVNPIVGIYIISCLIFLLQEFRRIIQKRSRAKSPPR